MSLFEFVASVQLPHPGYSLRPGKGPGILRLCAQAWFYPTCGDGQGVQTQPPCWCMVQLWKCVQDQPPEGTHSQSKGTGDDMISVAPNPATDHNTHIGFGWTPDRQEGAGGV